MTAGPDPVPDLGATRLGAFYRHRRVLVTGHSGLLGRWVLGLLDACGAEPVGLSRGDRPLPVLGRTLAVDVRDADAVRDAVADARPSAVLHLAAQSHTRTGQRRRTYETNVLGSVNVLDAAAELAVPACVVTGSSRDPALAHADDAFSDPYNASKLAVEHIALDYREDASRCDPGRGVAVARPAVLLGGGDLPRGRLVPEIMATLRAGGRPELRSPGAFRPWQHAVETAAGLLWLAAVLTNAPARTAPAYNFGPSLDQGAVPVGSVAARLRALWTGEPAAPETDVAVDGYRLDPGLAHHDLGWVPCWTLDRALEATVEWHRADSAGGLAADDVVAGQIRRYARDATAAGAAWAEPA